MSHSHLTPPSLLQMEFSFTLNASDIWSLYISSQIWKTVNLFTHFACNPVSKCSNSSVNSRHIFFPAIVRTKANYTNLVKRLICWFFVCEWSTRVPTATVFIFFTSSTKLNRGINLAVKFFIVGINTTLVIEQWDLL